MEPLTVEKKEFASKNFRLVHSFLSKNKRHYDPEIRGEVHKAYVKAVGYWNPNREVAFSTYAYIVMNRSVQRYWGDMVKRGRQFVLGAMSERALREGYEEVEDFTKKDYEVEGRVRKLVENILDGPEYMVVVCRLLVVTPMTLAEIGAAVNVSKQRVAQIEKNALEKLKRALQPYLRK